MRTIQTKYGDFAIDPDDRFISMSLLVYGCWAPDELKLIEERVPGRRAAVDAGACLGWHSRAFSRMGFGDIYAFEPNPICSDYLAQNLMHDYNTHVHELALSDSAGVVELRYDDHKQKNIGLGSIQVEYEVQSKTVPVKTVTLDSMELSACDVIKADVEGAENRLLLGAAETIANYKPALLIEYNMVDAELLSTLKRYGYKWELHRSSYNQTGGFSSLAIFPPSLEEKFLFCEPKRG